ncbi:MAG: 6-carboxytetrahydropterin synthase QueD [Spirochaetales bacterium]|nr:6-carboxytetrahydropterin synthase QueD [Spirochaetales bacterium]
MYEVTVEDTFSAAHYLAGHKGKCEKLHGHNYRVQVSATAQELNDQGMVIDFGILKNELKKILENLDHSFLNELKDFTDGSPTAERIALHIYGCLKKAVPAVKIRKVIVFETEKNSAVYYPDL